MLRKKFPNNEEEAKVFGGFISDDQRFFRTFSCFGSIEETLEEINHFLFANGYSRIDYEDLDEEFRFKAESLSISKQKATEEMVLSIKNPALENNLQNVIDKLIEFRDERDWEQFHSSKDLALAISIEASELLELFLWKGNEECNSGRLKEELADILSYCFLLAEKHNLNIAKIVANKIGENSLKYPVEKARGTARKYSEL